MWEFANISNCICVRFMECNSCIYSLSSSCVVLNIKAISFAHIANLLQFMQISTCTSADGRIYWNMVSIKSECVKRYKWALNKFISSNVLAVNWMHMDCVRSYHVEVAWAVLLLLLSVYVSCANLQVYSMSLRNHDLCYCVIEYFVYTCIYSYNIYYMNL